MVKLKKYTYQLTTKSPLILSPRQQEAFYKGIDYEDKDVAGRPVDIIKANSIYPFYRRGDYPKLREENVSYYIPGSSIKGSLLAHIQIERSHSLVVDDIELNSGDLFVGQLEKIQNTSLESQKQIKLEAFFKNVAIEMCKENTEKRGYVFCEEEPLSYFEACHKQTITKLEQWSKRIEELLQSEKAIDDKTELILKQAVENVARITKRTYSNTYFMLLGGYKGLLLSLVANEDSMQETEILSSALFMDPITKLPYGLVGISQVKSDE